MSEPEIDIGKQAKDIAEAANTSVDAVKKFAQFLDGMFGNVVSNAMGLMSDKLAYYRLEKAIMLQQKVEENLKERGVERRFVPVSFGLPIIEKATVEEDATLQEKWSNLLTNAADSTYGGPLRRNFTSILADVEPVDAKMVDTVVRTFLDLKDPEGTLFVQDKIAKVLKLSERDCENAVRNLMRLGLLKPGVIEGPLQFGENHKASAYKDTEMFAVTPMGVDFYRAVNDGTSKRLG